MSVESDRNFEALSKVTHFHVYVVMRHGKFLAQGGYNRWTDDINKARLYQKEANAKGVATRKGGMYASIRANIFSLRGDA